MSDVFKYIRLGASVLLVFIAVLHEQKTLAQQDPRQLLAYVINGLQTGSRPFQQLFGPEVFQVIYMQTGGTGIYPQLVQLGPAMNIALINQQQLPQGMVFYQLRSKHPHGSLEWHMGLGHDQKIYYLSFGPPGVHVGPAQPGPGLIVPVPSEPVEACQLYPALCSETVVVTASRLFAGPGQYPPEEFAAYGILAFRSRATSQDRDRHLMICEAYIAGLPHVSELRVEPAEQMVTIWPAESDEDADELNRMARTDVCGSAIDNYGLAASLQAIKEAAATKNADLSGIGPFLLAWSPSSRKGNKDALVLVMNLSGVTTYGQAQQILAEWSRDIEQNPELWKDGWDIEKLRLEIRLWVDRYGPQLLTLFGI